MANTVGVADHKAANTTTIPGLTVERTKSIVLLLVQLFRPACPSRASASCRSRRTR